MNRKVIHLLLICLAIYVFATVVSAEEPLQHGYYVSGNNACPEVPRISAVETKKLFDQGKLILVNPMPEKKSLLGAINIRADKLKNDTMTFPRNVVIAFYCS